MYLSGNSGVVQNRCYKRNCSNKKSITYRTFDIRKFLQEIELPWCVYYCVWIKVHCSELLWTASTAWDITRKMKLLDVPGRARTPSNLRITSTQRTLAWNLFQHPNPNCNLWHGTTNNYWKSTYGSNNEKGLSWKFRGIHLHAAFQGACKRIVSLRGEVILISSNIIHSLKTRTKFLNCLC